MNIKYNFLTMIANKIPSNSDNKLKNNKIIIIKRVAAVAEDVNTPATPCALVRGYAVLRGVKAVVARGAQPRPDSRLRRRAGQAPRHT